VPLHLKACPVGHDGLQRHRSAQDGVFYPVAELLHRRIEGDQVIDEFVEHDVDPEDLPDTARYHPPELLQVYGVAAEQLGGVSGVDHEGLDLGVLEEEPYVHDGVPPVAPRPLLHDLLVGAPEVHDPGELPHNMPVEEGAGRIGLGDRVVG